MAIVTWVCSTFLSLEHVSLEIYVDDTMPKEVEAVEDEIREALDMNPGKPTLTINSTTTEQVHILLAHSVELGVPLDQLLSSFVFIYLALKE